MFSKSMPASIMARSPELEWTAARLLEKGPRTVERGPGEDVGALHVPPDAGHPLDPLPGGVACVGRAVDRPHGGTEHTVGADPPLHELGQHADLDGPPAPPAGQDEGRQRHRWGRLLPSEVGSNGLPAGTHAHGREGGGASPSVGAIRLACRCFHWARPRRSLRMAHRRTITMRTSSATTNIPKMTPKATESDARSESAGAMAPARLKEGAEGPRHTPRADSSYGSRHTSTGVLRTVGAARHDGDARGRRARSR